METDLTVQLENMTEGNEYLGWLAEEILRRGWSDAFLADRAEIHQSTVSRVLNGTRGISCDFVIRTAQAIDTDPVWALRKAGILPDELPSVQEEQEALTILRSLPPPQRSSALLMLRGLHGSAGAGPAPMDQQPAARQVDVPQRETLDIDAHRQHVVKLLYTARGLPVPTGGTVEATATLVDVLLDEIERHERATDLLLEYFFAVTPRAVRSRLVSKFAEAVNEDSPEHDRSTP
jgi:transcriptional regulator with XRE-family HTH domain